MESSLQLQWLQFLDVYRKFDILIENYTTGTVVLKRSSHFVTALSTFFLGYLSSFHYLKCPTFFFFFFIIVVNLKLLYRIFHKYKLSEYLWYFLNYWILTESTIYMIYFFNYFFVLIFYSYFCNYIYSFSFIFISI